MRGLELIAVEPEAIHAGRPALFGATIVNRKRWLNSYSITIERLSPGASPRFLYVPRLLSGAERLVTWEDTLGKRGRYRLAGVRTTISPTCPGGTSRALSSTNRSSVCATGLPIEPSFFAPKGGLVTIASTRSSG